MRKEFERVSPEDVGISSASIMRLLDNLGPNVTEMHGIMIMRYGKVCSEGWWAPYAPGIRHGLQSHTKTYASTAIGLACKEGILSLDERIIDIFPEFTPSEISDKLKKLTVHHVLCMGCGMETMPIPSENWIADFLATPIVHEPGTTYMYNSTGSTLLAAIVNKRTKNTLTNYLKQRLFDKIGIDTDNLRWLYMPDGTEVGGGGLYATTEDNLRLMKLYADNGVCNGERLLNEDFIKRATTLQNESASEAKGNAAALDNFVGYGYQIWMCRPKGVYRADGAMGQFTIVSPNHDMIISITETAQGAHWAQNTLDMVWKFLDEIDITCNSLPINNISLNLQERLKTLAIQSVKFAPYSPISNEVSGKEFTCVQGNISLGMATGLWMSGGDIGGGIETIKFCFNTHECKIIMHQNKCEHILYAAMDGSRRYNTFNLPSTIETQLYLSAAWNSEKQLCVTARWIETCFEKQLIFTFDSNNKIIVNQNPNSFLFAPKIEGDVIFEAVNY